MAANSCRLSILVDEGFPGRYLSTRRTLSASVHDYAFYTGSIQLLIDVAMLRGICVCHSSAHCHRLHDVAVARPVIRQDRAGLIVQ